MAEAARLARKVSISPFQKKSGRVYERALLYYDNEEKLDRALEVLAKIGYRPTVNR